MSVFQQVLLGLLAISVLVVMRWLRNLALQRLNELRDSMLNATSARELRLLHKALVNTCYDRHWSSTVRHYYHYISTWVGYKLEIERGRKHYGVIASRAERTRSWVLLALSR